MILVGKFESSPLRKLTRFRKITGVTIRSKFLKLSNETFCVKNDALVGLSERSKRIGVFARFLCRTWMSVRGRVNVTSLSDNSVRSYATLTRTSASHDRRRT